jgi:hypothetical protein
VVQHVPGREDDEDGLIGPSGSDTGLKPVSQTDVDNQPRPAAAVQYQNSMIICLGADLLRGLPSPGRMAADATGKKAGQGRSRETLPCGRL